MAPVTLFQLKVGVRETLAAETVPLGPICGGAVRPASEKVCQLQEMAPVALTAPMYQVKLWPGVSGGLAADVPLREGLLTTAWFVVLSST